MRNMRWFWGVVTLLALTVGTGAFLYVTGDPGHYDPIFRAEYTAHLGTIVLHGVTSVMALVLFVILVTVTLVQQRFFAQRITYDLS